MFLGVLLHDLRFTWRLSLRNRSFTGAAVLLLGAAFGAHMAVFSVVRAVLLRPLPFPEPDRLVRLYNRYPNAGIDRDGAGASDYFSRRAERDVFEEVAVYRRIGHTLEQDGRPRRLEGLEVTPSYLKLLGLEPASGRSFHDSEGIAGRDAQVILSRNLALELAGEPASHLGRPLILDGAAHEVVGVMPPGASFPGSEVDLWTPLAFTEDEKRAQHDNRWEMIARLAPGISLAAAQERIDALNARQRVDHPSLAPLLDRTGFHTQIVPFHDDLVREVEKPLWSLWGIAAFMVVISCVSVGHLVLVRVSSRLEELATRSTLGADRGRLVRQLIIESSCLTVTGALIGLGAGWAGLQALAASGLDITPLGSEIRPDGLAGLVTLASGGAAGLALGALSLVLLRATSSPLLRGRGPSHTGAHSGRRLRGGLVSVQVATAFALLIGTGHLVAEFRSQLEVDLGFEVEKVWTTSVELPKSRYPDHDALRQFSRRAVEVVRSVPGIEAAALTDTVPLAGSYRDKVILAEDQPQTDESSLLSPNLVVVGPGFFDVLAIPLLDGRVFDARDGPTADPVIIVDETLARLYWPGRSAVGRRMYFSSNPDDLLTTDAATRWFTVIGVVETIRLRGWVDPEVGTYYFPYEQSPRASVHLTFRTVDDSSAWIEALRGRLSKIDPQLPIFDLQPVANRRDAALAPRRAMMLLALVFAGVAVWQAAFGLYAVLAHLGARRRQEIAIRLALGSSRAQIFRRLLGEGMLVLAIGLVTGLGLAIALRETIVWHQDRMTQLAPTLLSNAATILTLTALIACWIPAWRASRTLPAIALDEGKH